MSGPQQASTSTTTTTETFGLEGGTAAPERQSESGAMGHEHRGEGDNDHLALIYESQTDQFEAVVPFIRQGLEQGERCLYIVDENTEEEILEALRTGGVDVDVALNSGALSIHSKATTYLRGGRFDVDEMLEFLQETLAEAIGEEGYAGVRATAEMTWALDEGIHDGGLFNSDSGDEEGGLSPLVQYEGMLNRIYSGEDCVALCQYNRERFPSEVLSDIIQTHPLLVYDGTVCRNVHYQPPDEFFNGEHPSHDVGRTITKLVSHARTQNALRQSEKRARQQEVVAALGQQAVEDGDLGRLFAEAAKQTADTLGADSCSVLESEPKAQKLFLREGVGGQDGAVGEATIDPEGDSLAARTLRAGESVVAQDVGADPRLDESELPTGPDVASGIGVIVGPENDPWGVLNVYFDEPRAISERDVAFVQSVANTLAGAIERAEQEHYERKFHEITTDSNRAFEETVEELLKLGCDRFDLRGGGLTHLPSWGEKFIGEVLMGPEFPDAKGELPIQPDPGNFCRQAITRDEPTAVPDIVELGWDEDSVFEATGIRTYFGIRVSAGSDPYGTFWFYDLEPRDKPFTDNERTFLERMGRWVSDELGREKRLRHLRELNEITASPGLSFEEKLNGLFDLGCEWFGMDFGALNRVDPDADRLQVEYVSGEHPYYTPGFELPLSQTYCQAAADLKEAASVSEPKEEGYEGTTVYEEFGVKGYFGTYVSVDGGPDRTLAFLPSGPQEPVSEEERTYLELMGQWVKHELERKKRETELQQSKERFERVFRGSHDSVLIVDPRAGDIIDINPAASEMLGYSRDELLSLSPSDLHPDEMGRFLRFVEGVFEEGAGWSDELTCQPKTGDPIPAEISASAIQIGGRQCMLAIVRDVSERREHERLQRRLYEIAASTDRSFDQKLDALFDLGCEYFDLEVGGLARIDPRTDLFEVEAINGKHSHLIPGKQYPLSETYCLLPVDREGAAAVTDPVGRGFEEKLCYEKFGVRTYLGTRVEVDGDLDRTFFFLSNEPREEPFSEAEQTFHHLMGQWVEYELNKKQREKELKEVNQTLEERVEKRTRQVRELTSRVTMAEQRERERIARILHDGLQQKLYGIQLKVSSLQGGEPSGEGRENASVELAERMEEAIQMTRKLAVDMSPPVLDSDGLVGALEWLQSRMKNRYELEVRLTADREFRAQEEMRVLLFQIVRELLFNVVKHADVGRADVDLREEDGHLLIRVIDEGEGFDASEVEQRGPDEAFGLTAARERLRPFGGNLEVEAVPGEGTQVTVLMPLEKL